MGSASDRALFSGLSLPHRCDLISLSIPGCALYSANGAADPFRHSCRNSLHDISFYIKMYSDVGCSEISDALYWSNNTPFTLLTGRQRFSSVTLDTNSDGCFFNQTSLLKVMNGGGAMLVFSHFMLC